MSDITIPSAAGPLRAYFRVPDGEGPWPGVVVLHDIAGQTADNRHQTDWLAAAGFLAVAPDLYSRASKLLCVQATLRQMLARKGAAFEDIDAARTTLAGRADCTGRVGVIGFCMGGSFALLTAPAGGFAASSVNYGMVPKDADALLAGACPVIGSFGARDVSLRGAASRLEHALQANGVTHEVKEYADAGHAFLNNHDGVLAWIVARLGTGYHDASAADARARILAFFRCHLQQAGDETARGVTAPT